MLLIAAFHALLQIKVGNKVRSPAAGSTAPEPAAVVSDPVPASPALRPSENIWQRTMLKICLLSFIDLFFVSRGCHDW